MFTILSEKIRYVPSLLPMRREGKREDLTLPESF
jgi:hypothetical protein